MSRSVLGLDLATVSGWALLEERDGEWLPMHFDTIDTSPRSKDEPEGMRYVRFRNGLVDVLERFPNLNAIGIEQTFSQGFRPAQILYGMTAIALVALEDLSLPYAWVHPQKWQTSLCGAPLRWLSTKEARETLSKGERTRRRKTLIRESLNGVGAIEPGTTIAENEADAIGVALWLVENALVEPDQVGLGL